jgi:hypothetical protein
MAGNMCIIIVVNQSSHAETVGPGYRIGNSIASHKVTVLYIINIYIYRDTHIYIYIAFKRMS